MMSNEITIGIDNNKLPDTAITYNTVTNVLTLYHNNKDIHNDATTLAKKQMMETMVISTCYYYLTNKNFSCEYYVNISKGIILDTSKYKYRNSVIIENGTYLLFVISLFTATGTISKLQNKDDYRNLIIVMLKDTKATVNHKYVLPFLFNSNFYWLDEMEAHIRESLKLINAENIIPEIFANITYCNLLVKDKKGKIDGSDTTIILVNELISKVLGDGSDLKIDTETQVCYERLALVIYFTFAIALSKLVNKELKDESLFKKRIAEIHEIYSNYMFRTVKPTSNSSSTTLH